MSDGKPNNVLKEAMNITEYVRSPIKLLEILATRDPYEEVEGIDEFKGVCEVFGLTEKCAEELWEHMNKAKDKVDEEVEGGVMFTYSCAMLSIAISLKDGKCKNCAHRPGNNEDEIGEPVSKMVQ